MEIRLTTPSAARAWHDVRVLYFQFVIVAAVFGGIAWVAAGRGGGVVDAVPDRPDVALPDDRQLAKADIDAARFTVGWRGYRMDEVDQVLDRLAAEIEYRDRLIAELTGSPAAAGVYQPVGRHGADASQGAPDQGAAPAGPQAARGDDASGPAGGDGDQGDAGPPDDGNPLSAWYRRPE